MAAGQRIEQTVGCGGQEKVKPDRTAMSDGRPCSDGARQPCRGQDGREQKRMGKPAMTEQVAGTGAKRDCDNVDIRRDRTGDSERQQSARNCAVGKSGEQRRSRYAMGKDGGHSLTVTQSMAGCRSRRPL